MIVYSIFGHIIINLIRIACGMTTHIVEKNVSMEVNSLNVSGQTGIARSLTTLYNDSSNWFEAREKCSQLVDKHFENAPPTWYRWRAAAQALSGIDLPTNFTFWNGIFRPIVKSDSWYRFTDSLCLEVTTELSIEDFREDERCISGQFVDFQTGPVFTADMCTNSYPYTCFEWVSNVTMYAYNGFVLDTILSSNTVVKSSQFVNASSDIDCAAACEKDIECFAYSYNFANTSCILISHFNYSTNVDITIARTNNNATFGVKQGITFSFSENKTTVVGPVNFTFPECVIDTVPRNYCQCEDNMTEEELQRIVDELIRNLTIDQSQTSKNKQKYISATDDRVYSRVTGSIAVFIVICFLSVPFLSDIVYLKYFIQKYKRTKDVPLPTREELYGYAKTK